MYLIYFSYQNDKGQSGICHISSVIRQKGKFQNGGNKKTKLAKFSEKTNISGGKKCSFFGKFGSLYFLVTGNLRFTILPYKR